MVTSFFSSAANTKFIEHISIKQVKTEKKRLFIKKIYGVTLKRLIIYYHL